MMQHLRRFIAITISVIGSCLALYVGGYLLFLLPLHVLVVGFMAKSLTLRVILTCVVKIFISATVGGAVWVFFDIIAGYFRDDEIEE